MKIRFLLAGLLVSLFTQAQSKFWVKFADKGENTNWKVEESLSQKAIDRRLDQNISIDFYDQPICAQYIDNVRLAGADIINKSKWLNAVSVQATEQEIAAIEQLPFVTDVRLVAQMKQTSAPEHISLVRSTKTSVSSLNYGISGNQIELVSGHYLHEQNYRGQGVIIAVLDGGFFGTDNIEAFDSLWSQGRVLATWDFVDGDNDIFHVGSHGTNVLSTMGGFIDGTLIGSAPSASYLLLKSENEASETPIEEDNWVAAAEFADSAGAQIINSSLGYNTFDGGIGNYTHADLDGRKATTTIAATIAARKGILVVNSAGNEGSGFWQKIITPADADSILAVGGVDASGEYVQFSSRGPTADGRIKPDIAAQAAGVILSRSNGLIGPGNGTSFAAPVISGLAACLWQKHPKATMWQVRQSIIESSHLYANPNNSLGHGIPDFLIADAILTDLFDTVDPQEDVLLMPNPFVDELTLFIRTETYPQIAEVTVSDMHGNVVSTKRVEVISKKTDLSAFRTLASGMYIFEINFNGQRHRFKMIR